MTEKGHISLNESAGRGGKLFFNFIRPATGADFVNIVLLFLATSPHQMMRPLMTKLFTKRATGTTAIIA